MTKNNVALAILAGFLLALSQPPSPFGIVVFLAMIPWFITLSEKSSRDAFGLSYVVGITYFALTFHWILFTRAPGLNLGLLMVPAYILAVLYLGLYIAAMGVIFLRSLSKGLWIQLLIIPAAVVAMDYIRGHGDLQFPWLYWGYARSNSITDLQLASIGGIHLVTFWVVMVNVILYRLLSDIRKFKYWAIALLIIVIPIIYGSIRINNAILFPYFRVLMVQSELSPDEKSDIDHSMKIYYELASQDSMTDVVILPESGLRIDFLNSKDERRLASTILHGRQKYLISGGISWSKLENRSVPHNSAYILNRKGTLVGTYNKMKLVPFGERWPLVDYFPFIETKINFGEADFHPGKEFFVFDTTQYPGAMMICYESVFPDLSRQFVKNGATWLVVLTNNIWFGKSIAAYQHAAMGRVRAVENGVSFLACTNTGPSIIVDPLGHLQEESQAFKRQKITGLLYKPLPMTVFTRWGDWVSLLSMILLLLYAFIYKRFQNLY